MRALACVLLQSVSTASVRRSGKAYGVVLRARWLAGWFLLVLCSMRETPQRHKYIFIMFNYFVLLSCSSPNVKIRKQYVQLVESVRSSGGEVKIFSSMHPSGERKCLRYIHRNITNCTLKDRFSVPCLWSQLCVSLHSCFFSGGFVDLMFNNFVMSDLES